MATQTIPITALPGVDDLEIRLFSVSPTPELVDSVVAVETDDDLGRYMAVFTDLPAGRYRISGVIDEQAGFVNDFVTTQAATGTYLVDSEKVAATLEQIAEDVAGGNIVFSGTVLAGNTGWVTVDNPPAVLATANYLFGCLMEIAKPNGTKQYRWIRSHFIQSGDAGFNPDLDFTAAPANGDTITIYKTPRWTANVTHWRDNQPGNVDSNGFVPGNLAAINGNTTRAATLATAMDNNRLDASVSSRATPQDVANALSSLSGRTVQIVSLYEPAKRLLRIVAGNDYNTTIGTQIDIPIILPSGIAVGDSLTVTLNATHETESDTITATLSLVTVAGKPFVRFQAAGSVTENKTPGMYAMEITITKSGSDYSPVLGRLELMASQR